MSGEEETPIVENKPFPGSLVIETRDPRDDDSSTKSSSTEGSSPTSSPKKHSSSLSKSKEIPSKSPAISPETDMSASYHEIFDTQMPGACAIKEDNEEEEDEDTTNTRLELPLICCDNNTISTTEYLTSKLVEDSLKWQNESKAIGTSSLIPSPRDSPAKKIRTPQNICDIDIKSLSVKEKNLDVLDPTAIDDIEKHARYLAACVDSMVENLSGVLQSASALTVETLEIHRDGALKTCDQADNNIKSMYQLMAKVEELNKSMGIAYRIGEDVKEIRRLVELYETLL